MLQRAAEAGDARASLLLGATYNPIELEHFGVRGAFTSVAEQRGPGARRRNSSAPSKRSSDLSCWQNATTDRWADCPFPNETRRVKR